MTKYRYDVSSVSELAEYLRVPQSTVYKLAQDGLSENEVGKYRRFSKLAFDRWLQAHKSGAEDHWR